MSKKLLFFISSAVLVTFFASCDFSETESGSTELTPSNQECLEVRAACYEQPYSKTVTYNNPAIVTISGTDGPITDSASFNYKLSAIMNGSRTYYYNVDCYKGTLKSTSFYMYESPTYSNGVITCKVKISYAGTVYNAAALDPCASLPYSKTVTYNDPTIVTISGTDGPITDSASFNYKLSAIMNGLRTYYYSSGCYKGTLRSTSFYMYESPTSSNGWITCKVKISYAGTVYNN